MVNTMNILNKRTISIVLSLLLLFVSTPLLALETTIVKQAIRDKGANWVAGETSVSKLPPEEKKRLFMPAEFDRPPARPQAKASRHAASAGADAIAAVGPCYFKASSTRQLIAYLAKIAEVVPHLPFYYYHIPHLSGNNLDMIEFLQESAELIPSLKGIKYSALTVYEFQSCKELFEGRYDVFFGCDEMLTSGLSAGADSAIGSTYNLAGRLYRRIKESFAQGDIETNRKLQ